MATATGPLTEQDLAAWQRDGYIFIKQLFDAEETALLLKYGRGDERLRNDAYGRRDATGQVTKLALYNHAGDDLYSTFAKSRRIVDRMERDGLVGPAQNAKGDREIYIKPEQAGGGPPS